MLNKSKVLTLRFLIPMLVFLFFIAPGHAYAASPSQLIPYKNTSSKIIALTFDDCNDSANLSSIIQSLAANNVKATFFPTGESAAAYPSLLKLAFNNGNDIGNHTYSHPHLSLLTYDQIVNEITSADVTIGSAIGQSPKPYFKPPYYEYNSTALQALGDTGYSKTITLSVNSLDWQGITPEEITQNVLNGAFPGAIVSLHASDKARTPEAIQDIISGLKNKGYKLLTISELLNYVSVSGIVMNTPSADITKGQNLSLTATISPSYATNKKVTWTSSNDSIVSVDSNGTITGVSLGTATVTATTDDLGFTASCQVTVKAPSLITPVRYGGIDRFETAAKVSSAGWTTSDNVVLVTAYNFPDALVGVPFAYLKNAPILLTNVDTVPDFTSNEITRLGAKNIYILGGPSVVSSSIEDGLKAKGLNVFRYAGIDRFETAFAVSDQVLATGASKTAVLTTAYNYPDALSIGPYAAISKYPVLYTDPLTLTEKTKNYLIEKKITRLIIPGSSGAVSLNVENQLTSMGIEVQRIGGADRYLTSYSITKTFESSFGNDVMIASGENFPDALSGGALAAKKGIPILLVKNDFIILQSSDYIKSKGAMNLYIIGANGVISDNIVDLINQQ